jgi:4-amino-4-deoxy-L-arabinose transferase-like glycosyltransferase
MRWLLWLCVLAALIDLRAFGLTDLDEGFYASVAWEMRQSGDWRTPTFLGEPWFEKPPLLYWLMVGSMRVFGENEFALRLPSALMYALTILLLAWWGNRRLGAGAGSWAALLFALAPLSLILARLAITDMALAFFLTLAVIALWEVRGLGWSLIGGVALGLAFLTKGPFGLGLVGLLYLWNARTLHARGLRFRWVLFALGVALLTALPWYVGVYLQHGAAFFNEFVVKQNLLRFAGGDTAHSALPLIQRGDVGGVLAGIAVYLLFYVVVLWLGGLSMVGGANVLWAREDDPLRLYLRRWAWLVFGLFTLSFTKLPAYIFPMFPALALLVGARVAQARIVYTPTRCNPPRSAGREAHLLPRSRGEVGRGAKSRAPARRLLTACELSAERRHTGNRVRRGGVGGRRAVSSALGGRAVGNCARAGHAVGDARAESPCRAAMDEGSGRACAGDRLERRADGL